MFQFAAWLEDWITKAKLVVADEVSAHIEPRRAMAVLMNADHQGSQEKKKSKGKSKSKGSQTKPTTKSGDVDFDDDA